MKAICSHFAYGCCLTYDASQICKGKIVKISDIQIAGFNKVCNLFVIGVLCQIAAENDFIINSSAGSTDKAIRIAWQRDVLRAD